jgi:hypothetical protein
MEPESSLLCTRDPTTSLDTEPDQSSTRHHILILEHSFQYFPPISATAKTTGQYYEIHSACYPSLTPR